MKVKPYQISAEAWFRQDNLLVCVGLDAKGKFHIRPTTTGGQHAGDYIPDPNKLDEHNKFIKDCLESFKDIIKINHSVFVVATKEEDSNADQ